MIKKILLIAAAAIGGIYLTSEEGKKARETIRAKKIHFWTNHKRLAKRSK